MKSNITNSLITRLAPKEKPYDVRDTNLTGFLIRVNISGKMLYMCEYGRGKRVTIGKVGVLSTAQARDKAKEILGDAVRGIEPKPKQTSKDPLTFYNYIEKYYIPWVETNRKAGKETAKMIRAKFLLFLENRLLPEINPLLIEQWRTQRIQKGIALVTVNRDLVALKSALSKAVEWELLDQHPLRKLKLSKVDTKSKVRYLTEDEESKLRRALDERETGIKCARERANIWREERGYEKIVSLQTQPFADYLKPMVLLSLNTGIRRGELFNLTWEDCNFNESSITINGESSKSGKTRHIPLNSEALAVLKAWHKQIIHTKKEESKEKTWIFPNKNNLRFNNVKKSWAAVLKQAQITRFRWHDMRHHFASKLVMAGVDLNTVRELLGHADIEMTLRYAHLAPEHKANAVAKLVQSPEAFKLASVSTL